MKALFIVILNYKTRKSKAPNSTPWLDTEFSTYPMGPVRRVEVRPPLLHAHLCMFVCAYVHVCVCIGWLVDVEVNVVLEILGPTQVLGMWGCGVEFELSLQDCKLALHPLVVALRLFVKLV